MAVQVDPIKPTLKAPGPKRLTLKRNHPLSSFAFKLNLRRYSKEGGIKRLYAGRDRTDKERK